MARGKRLSDDLRSTIVSMARTHTIHDLVQRTGCHLRTVERILHEYRLRGTVARDLTIQELRGCPRSLTVNDTKVCNRPDLCL